MKTNENQTKEAKEKGHNKEKRSERHQGTYKNLKVELNTYHRS